MKVRATLEFDTVDGSVKVVDINRKETPAAVDPGAPFGRDPFGTPFVSEADRERMQNLVRYGSDEAANYKGSIDPDTLGLYDWAFWQKRELYRAPGNYAIFTKRPIVRDPADGRVLQNPENELAGVDVSEYGGPLKQFAPGAQS